MEIPPTQYARSGEIAIAYQVHGAGEHDLLYSGGPASNVDGDPTLPTSTAFDVDVPVFVAVDGASGNE